MIGDLFDSPWKILIVVAVLVVLFGSLADLRGAAEARLAAEPARQPG
jgi:Sec-independent protein translocase protein TatA